MSKKAPGSQSEYWKRWYEQNKERDKEKRRASDKRQYLARYEWLYERKGTVCTDCGETFPPDELHFHHRDPATKSFDVSRVGKRSLAALEAEAAKCDVFCQPCHMAAHKRLRSGGD